MKERKL